MRNTHQIGDKYLSRGQAKGVSPLGDVDVGCKTTARRRDTEKGRCVAYGV